MWSTIFSSLRNADVSYMGMTSRQLVTRAQVHLNLNFNKTAKTQQIRSCQCCKTNEINANFFKIIRQYHTDYEAKVQEALLIILGCPENNGRF